jgi:hypothetical protein
MLARRGRAPARSTTSPHEEARGSVPSRRVKDTLGAGRYRHFVGFLRMGLSWLRRLGEPLPQVVPRSWLHCPICDRELVGPYPSGAILSGPHGLGDAMEPSRQELVAKCPDHGRRPYNDPDRKPPFRQVSRED